MTVSFVVPARDVLAIAASTTLTVILFRQNMFIKVAPPNDHHQQWEPAANDVWVAADLTGWLPSAAWCGWASSLSYRRIQVLPRDRLCNNRTYVRRLASLRQHNSLLRASDGSRCASLGQ